MSTMTQPAPDYPLRYETRDALAALPWFEQHQGRIVVADSSIGPIIDVHTHYALPSVGTTGIDLEASHDDSHLLLGRCCAHHLDVYANLCFTPTELAAMKRDLLHGGVRGKGLRKYHTAPNLAADMASMGIVHSIVLGIDMPVPMAHVARTLKTASTRSDVTGFGSVYPRRWHAREKFEEQLHAGAQGVKIHPPNMFIRPDDPRAMKIYAWCGDVGVPVFWHCGPAGIEPKLGAYCGQVRFYEAALRAHPKTTFVLGHSGATQHWEAIGLYRKYDNAWLDFSSISTGQMRDVIEHSGDHSRLLFGSDWPFYHPILPLAKVLIVTEGNPSLRKKILYDNASRLLERTRARTRA
jgi:predicted TIM-barrel fold metal-dependent hydrolase